MFNFVWIRGSLETKVQQRYPFKTNKRTSERAEEERRRKKKKKEEEERRRRKKTKKG